LKRWDGREERTGKSKSFERLGFFNSLFVFKKKKKMGGQQKKKKSKALN